jgi:penicillin-binding protein 1A
MLLGTELGLVGIKCDRNEVLVVSGSTKRNWASTLFKLFIVVPICIVVAVVNAGFLLGTYMYFARDLPTVSELERYEPKVPCRVTDSSEGCKELKFHCRAPEFPVDLERLPPHVVNAFLAAEDRSFLVHDSPKLPTVLYYSFVVKKCRCCGWPGPFTRVITMGFLPHQQRSFGQFTRARILEIRLERTWEKKRILDVFLNEIYLGNDCYGLGAASQRYFGKPAEHLSVAEAALLAGLVRSQSQYNPVKYPDRADERKRYVLEVMLRAGFLSPDECRKAKEESLPTPQ